MLHGALSESRARVSFERASELLAVSATVLGSKGRALFSDREMQGREKA